MATLRSRIARPHRVVTSPPAHTSVPYAKLEKPPIDRQFDGRVRTLTIFFEATRAGLEDL